MEDTDVEAAADEGKSEKKKGKPAAKEDNVECKDGV